MSNELKETLAEMRAFNGDLTGCFRTLQSGKLMQASSSPEVAEEWRNMVSVAGRRPTRTWQEVAISLGFDPNDPRFTFTLGTSTVMGTDGPVEVNTLENVMGHLPKRSAGGADGTGFDIYSCMDASSVEPFVQYFISPLSPLDERDILGRTVRILLASGLGVGLDKKGLGRPVDLRPLGLGDSLRRISTRCISLQSKGQNAASVEMAHELQCGVGMQGGVDIGYAIPNRSIDSLVKAEIPSPVLVTDAGNAYGSIMQDTIIEEVVQSRPELVGFWSVCYGGNEAPWMILDDGSRIPVTALFQGCGLSPDFFALGVRGLLRSIRTEIASLPSAQGVVPTTSAYLDDIYIITPLEAMFDSLDILRELGPKIGLHFDNIRKNYFYVPVRFKDQFLKVFYREGC